MMRVRLLTALAGPTVDARPGDVIECDEATAHRLIERGMAEPVESVEETAVQSEVELASTRPAVTRGRKRKN